MPKKYYLDINNRPFEAIKAGTKRVEGRTNTSFDKTKYSKFEKGDLIIFENNETKEKIEVEVSFVRHYETVKLMLEKEGPEKVLSSFPKTIEHGIKSYNQLEGYKKGIKENGIYAIGVKLIR